jgi:alkylhydroperoxidase/carboxymuconolactone decarboxylase family protein YurZ
MTKNSSYISQAFETFSRETPDQTQAWATLVQELGRVSTLESKSGQLAYISVLAALNRTSGIPFHVISAREAGATRDEIISAVLLGLPAAGNVETQALPVALETYDAVKSGES